jgi:hypothetical protein
MKYELSSEDYRRNMGSDQVNYGYAILFMEQSSFLVLRCDKSSYKYVLFYQSIPETFKYEIERSYFSWIQISITDRSSKLFEKHINSLTKLLLGNVN